uniref:protein-tyrosine-phosphatase n=1 Tax=Parascaris univalens TaxID=6257 RepID=A0A915BXU3_PARUN
MAHSWTPQIHCGHSSWRENTIDAVCHSQSELDCRLIRREFSGCDENTERSDERGMIRFGSGSYSVRDSERLNPETVAPPIYRTIVCTVYFLDDTERNFEIDRHSRGQVLLDKVFEHLELVEKDYFGLQFICVLDPNQPGVRRWLDPTKSIRKQMLYPPYRLFFQVKFYVNDPAKLVEEYTRYHVFLQLRKDLLDGRLTCPESTSALLGSYAAQSEFGDYSSDEHGSDYLDGFRVIPEQSASFLKSVAELHKLHKGQSPAEAEYNFLEQAKKLELYGVDLYPAKESSGTSIGVGVSSSGVLVFRSGHREALYPWSSIMKLSFKKKLFSVYMRTLNEDNVEEDTVMLFNVQNPESCKALWKSCIEHHTFFRLIVPPTAPPKSIFNIGSRYRYSGRTEFQSMEEMRRRARVERTFQRHGSRGSRATVTGTCSTSRTHTPSNITSTSPDLTSRFFSESAAPSTRRVSPSRRDINPRLQDKSRVPPIQGSSIPSAYHRCPRETTFGIEEDGTWQSVHNMIVNGNAQACTSASIHHRTSNGHVTTNGFRKSALLNGSPSSTLNGFVNGSTVNRFVPNGSVGSSPLRIHSPRGTSSCKLQNTGSPRSSVASHSSIGSGKNVHNGGSSPRTRRSPRQSPPIGEDSLVVVRMRADAQGRFGFNVKGGADQNYPIIVSRVASGSAADKCNPRLNEGDQVLVINGVDVASMAHDQVVRFIRSARETLNGELVLTIRPNVYRCGDDIEEPDAQCVPETPHVAPSVPRSDLLSQSLLLLKESLASGKVVSQFDLLYRKKPGMSMDDCRLSSNVNKNRYRDVCPYDETRVRINAPSGDYINASFVNMEIPSSGIVNRYIAAQGPLPHTSGDFWHMVWEQLSTTIVMLTTTIERGRVKCHQYWPRIYESHDYGYLQISCFRERETPNCCYREFTIKDKTTKEERRVTQMQYTAWPDHGVPDDPKHFIEFVDEVRRARVGSVDPIVVHCSAGIGRTGVLILMETAACLVEANEPVYPLDIVRTMRDQRAMLIQTPGQYTFVCESILRAYHDGLIKPLAEYRKRS